MDFQKIQGGAYPISSCIKNNKHTIPEHLGIPIDLVYLQPYHSINIQETEYYPNHKEIKMTYISDYPMIDNDLFDNLYEQSDYSTQTHNPPNKQIQNKSQKNKSKTRSKSQKKTKN